MLHIIGRKLIGNNKCVSQFCTNRKSPNPQGFGNFTLHIRSRKSLRSYIIPNALQARVHVRSTMIEESVVHAHESRLPIASSEPKPIGLSKGEPKTPKPGTTHSPNLNGFFSVSISSIGCDRTRHRINGPDIKLHSVVSPWHVWPLPI